MRQKVSGIYLLPNLLTTGSLFSAFYAIIAAMNGLYDTAVIAIFVGMIADSLDGRIARMTNTQTAFGAEYDSLSDMVTFGVAPAILAYRWGLETQGKLGWLISFMYIAAVALRLARFNTQLDTADKRYFQGIPCPAAAAVVVSLIWLCENWMPITPWMNLFTSMLMIALSLLMVSNIRFHSFKELDVKGKIRFLHVLIMVIGFILIAIHPPIMLFLISFSYAISGPFQTLIALHKLRRQRRKFSSKLAKKS